MYDLKEIADIEPHFTNPVIRVHRNWFYSQRYQRSDCKHNSRKFLQRSYYLYFTMEEHQI